MKILEIMDSGEDEKGKLFVGGLSWDTTHGNLLKYFSRYGQVIDCVVMKNSMTGKSRGFGFVKFADPSLLDLILLDAPHWLDGRQIDVKVCNPRSLNCGGKSVENSRRKIFVGGLPVSCDEAQLREVFRKFGTIEECTIMYDQEKNKSRGFGFLTFESEQGVDRVCAEHFIYINGKQVECKRAEPRFIKSMADTGQQVVPYHPPNQTYTAQPIAMPMIQGPPGAAAGVAALTNGHPQGAMSGSPQALVPSPVGAAAMPHPVANPAAFMAPAPFYAPTPMPMVHYAGSYGPYFCLPEPSQPMIRPGMYGIHPGDGAVPAGPHGMAAPPLQQYAYPAADGPGGGGGSGPAPATNGAEAGQNSSGGAAQISFQPSVTYTLAPGMTPMPGGGITGPLFGHGDATGYMQQLSSIGRIPTNHHPTSLLGYHPYRRM